MSNMSVEDKGSIPFELPDTDGYRKLGASIAGQIDIDPEVLKRLLQKIIGVSKEAVVTASPDTMEVTVGVTVSGEGNLVIAKLSGQASLQVKLIWNKDKNTK